jgi:hypothetical protein
MQDAATDSAASGRHEVAGSSSSLVRRLPSRSSSSPAQHHHEPHHATDIASKTSTKPQRHVSFREFVHERIFSVVPAAPAPEQSAGDANSDHSMHFVSSDGETSFSGDATSLDSTSVVADDPCSASRLHKEGVSASLCSKIRLPPPPSPPDSPPCQLVSSANTNVSQSPLRRSGNGSSNVTAKTTFESILFGICEGGTQAHVASGEGVTEKELKLSHERMANSLRERLLSICNRLKDISVLEACHPSGSMIVVAIHFPCPALSCLLYIRHNRNP